MPSARETPTSCWRAARSREGHQRLAQTLDGGYRRLTELGTRERFSSVVVFDRFYAVQRFEELA